MQLESKALVDGARNVAHPTHDTYVSTKEAARILGLSYRTLEDWRLRGGGPIFRKLGRMVRYARSDLEAFMAAAARTNTAGAVPA